MASDFTALLRRALDSPPARRATTCTILLHTTLGKRAPAGSHRRERALATPPFAPLHRIDGYLPIEDHGLIGDGATAALVARDGAVVWLCVPRFDSPPLFAGILDVSRGGHFTLAPEDVVEARQYYEDESGVLVTELRCRSGLVRVRDALTLRSGADLDEDTTAARGELMRHVQVLEGAVRLQLDVEPYGGGDAEIAGNSIRIECERRPDLQVYLRCTRPLGALHETMELGTGEQCYFTLRWSGWTSPAPDQSPATHLQATLDAWSRWKQKIRYEGTARPLVLRAAITLKMLDYFENGGMVAAPTSSLPEQIGGRRNWDYRYVWTRDAAFSVWAFHRIGLYHEAAGFLNWVLNANDRQGRPRVLYDLDGEEPMAEREADDLEGYRRSAPVRWGNAAVSQQQNDLYGEVLDCAYQWARHHGQLGAGLWEQLRRLVETAARAWHTPDRGIWEVRAAPRTFTYSVALCHVALDRGARLAEQFGLPGDVAAWRAEAARIKTAILERAWDEDSRSFTQHLGGGGLDASLLALPLRRVIAADDPRMVATTEAITRRLRAGDGLLYRYIPEQSPDGIEGGEGAFLLCSFWLVDNLALQGRIDEADALFDSLCQRANPLGLLPEQIDPASGAFLGNFPQAFSHFGLISSAVNLQRARQRGGQAGAAPGGTPPQPD